MRKEHARRKAYDGKTYYLVYTVGLSVHLTFDV